MLAGYIGGTPLTCTDIHDIADANGYLGRGTIVDDSGFVMYRTLFNNRAGTPQLMLLDRWMRIRAYTVGWDAAVDPPFYQSMIETLLAE